MTERSKARVYADRLLGLRVRIPAGARIFMLCVVNKDKKGKTAGESRQRKKTSTDEVQSTREYKQKKSRWRACVFCL